MGLKESNEKVKKEIEDEVQQDSEDNYEKEEYDEEPVQKSSNKKNVADLSSSPAKSNL
jgi:hypothetical protein